MQRGPDDDDRAVVSPAGSCSAFGGMWAGNPGNLYLFGVVCDVGYEESSKNFEHPFSFFCFGLLSVWFGLV